MRASYELPGGPRRTAETWISQEDERLPERIRELAEQKRTCPGLWIAGDPGVLHRGVRVAIIGSRHPRPDSMQRARRLAVEVAQAGMTVVSGLAIGVDGAAHRAALDAGGATIAVLAGGLARVHPVPNRDLARRIAGSSSPLGVVAGRGVNERGAVLCEYGGGEEECRSWQFRERNRIIAALSDYVVVVQAKPRSGSMTTASDALDLGVPVGVLPAPLDDPAYQGSLDLIRDGADCVMEGGSLAKRLELHGVVRPGFSEAWRDPGQTVRVDPADPGRWTATPSPGAARASAVAAQTVLFDHPLASILDVPRPLDDVAELAGIGRRDVRRMLFELEAEGLVVTTPDDCWVASTAAVR